MVDVLDTSFVQEVAYAVHESVYNPAKPIIPDRKAYPLWSDAMANAIEEAFTGDVLKVKMQKDGGLTGEYWTGKQILTFDENEVDIEMEFEPARYHLGVEFVHTELETLGYSVEPNASRSKSFAKKLRKADLDRVMNLFEMKLNDMENAWNVNMDVNIHLDGTQDALAFPGLDGLIPLGADSGTIGGQPRTDPLFQHQVQLALTTGVGGTMERGLQQIIRDAMVNSRGTPSRIDKICAGWEWIDGYIAFCRANDMPYQRVGGNGPVTNMDAGVPDSAIHFNGIPVIHDPTFEVLDAAGNYSGTKWTKRAYLLDSSTLKFAYFPGKMKKFSAPLDPGDQRVTRLSLEGRHCMFVTKPSANGVCTIA